MEKRINSVKDTEAIGLGRLREDWKKLPEFNHKFYPVPKGEDVRELYSDIYYIHLETRRTKRGERVYTYAIPILRKETTVTGNEWSPGLLLLKYHVKDGRAKSVYYSIVKMTPQRLEELIGVLRKLSEYCSKPFTEWAKLPTTDIIRVAKIVALKEGIGKVI